MAFLRHAGLNRGLFLAGERLDDLLCKVMDALAQLCLFIQSQAIEHFQQYQRLLFEEPRHVGVVRHAWEYAIATLGSAPAF
ncbi:hypothetical protein, partial [Aeromonas hydrophila]